MINSSKFNSWLMSKCHPTPVDQIRYVKEWSGSKPSADIHNLWGIHVKEPHNHNIDARCPSSLVPSCVKVREICVPAEYWGMLSNVTTSCPTCQVSILVMSVFPQLRHFHGWGDMMQSDSNSTQKGFSSIASQGTLLPQDTNGIFHSMAQSGPILDEIHDFFFCLAEDEACRE